MLGYKPKVFKTHLGVSIDDLVPPDNFYRQVEAKLDLTFVRDLVKHTYSSQLGRPSIDPVVFFRLQLIMFFEGIRSERKLMEQVNLNLAFRWYIGYDLNEKVPNHSSLSKIREGYGLEVFQRFFEYIVELCIAAGLVWGKELYFDGTKVQANADVDTLVPRFYYEARQHLKELFEQERQAERPEGETPQVNEHEAAETPRGFVEKYDGTRILSRKSHWYKRKTDDRVSLTDPDASPMKSSTGAKAKLGYHVHYVVDGGKARIILAALATPASIMDNTPMLDLERWVRFRWLLRPKIAVGDAKYGTVANLVGLEQAGIRAYIPIPDFKRSSKFYPPSQFEYDEERDRYICPQGHSVSYWYCRSTELAFVYRADADICNACPVKANCTDSDSGRHIFRSFFQADLDRVAAYPETAAYQKAMNKRKVWPEPLFGEAKQWHGLCKFRLRRLEKVNIQTLMTAAGQNIKRLLRAKYWHRPLKPAASQALDVPVSLADTVLRCFLPV